MQQQLDFTKTEVNMEDDTRESEAYDRRIERSWITGMYKY